MSPYSSIKKILVVFALLLVGTTGFYFFSTWQHTRQKAAYRLSEADIIDLIKKGSYDEAIDKSKEASSYIVTPENTKDLAYLKSLSLIQRAKGSDIADAVQALKGIALDTSLHPQKRANAYIALASIYYRDKDHTIIKQQVFQNEPFSKYLTNANGDVAEAAVDLLKTSNAITSQAGAYYYIASIDRARLIKAGLNSADTTQIAIAQEAKAAFTAWDTTLNRAKYPNEYYTRALVVDVLHKYFAKDFSDEDINTAFEAAIAQLQYKPDMGEVLARASLSYAASLNERQPQEKAAHIVDLLASVVRQGEESVVVRQALADMLKNSTTVAKQMPSLEQKSPDFAKFVATLGKMTS